MSTDILSEIVAHKRSEIETLRERGERERWMDRLSAMPPAASFLDQLRGFSSIRAIAEIKRASPSAGIIRSNFDPASIARTYAENGAACISVLTDNKFFHGSIEHLRTVSQTVATPLLRKDFILDAVQLVEARLNGASAALLIAECLSGPELARLVRQTMEIGLTPLVELFEPANLSTVLDSGAKLIGINNRNLRTFVTDLRHTLDLLDRIPADCTVVSESGIRDREDVLLLEQSGVHAILVGESLMRAADPGKKLGELLGST